MKRFLAALLLTLVGLLAAGWLLLPSLLERQVIGQLSARGIQVEAITLRLPGWGRLEVPRLILGYRQEGVESRAETGDIVLEYSLASLVARRAERLSIPRLRLERDGAPAAGDGKGGKAFTPLLIGELLGDLPTDSVVVDQFDARWRWGESLLTAAGSLTLHPRRGEGVLEALVAAPDLDAPVQVTLRMAREGAFRLQVGDGAVDLVGRFGDRQTRAGTGRLDLRIDRLPSLLTAILPGTMLPGGIEGEVGIDWSEEETDPGAEALAGRFRLAGKVRAVEGTIGTEADLSGRFLFDSGGLALHLSDDSRLDAHRRVAETHVAAQLAPAGVSITWLWGDGPGEVVSTGTLIAHVNGEYMGSAIDGELRMSAFQGSLEEKVWQTAYGVRAEVGAPGAIGARLQMEGTVVRGGGTTRVIARSGSTVWLPEHPASGLPKVDLQLSREALLRVEEDGTWVLDQTRIEGKPHGPFQGHISLRRLTAEVGATGDGGEARVEVRADLHDVTGPGEWRIPLTETAGQLMISGGEINGDVTMESASLLSGHGRFRHAWGAGAGTADFSFETPWLEASGKGAVSRRLNLKSSPFDLDTGRLEVQGEVNWTGGAVSPKMLVRARGLGGSWQTLRFEGGEATVPLFRTNGWYTAGHASVRIGRLDAGAVLEEISLDAKLSLPDEHAPRLVLRGVEAKLLGGSARSEVVDLDFARERHLFSVEVERIELARLLRLEQQEGIEGTGVLEGTLPMEINPEGLRITGQLRARDPGGRIRYHPGEGALRAAASSANIELALRALSDYRYHLLVADVDYRPGGQLSLRLTLQGRNPELNSGQPINLNVTVEENVPALLRSLRMADDLSDAIGRRVQENAKGVNQ